MTSCVRRRIAQRATKENLVQRVPRKICDTQKVCTHTKLDPSLLGSEMSLTSKYKVHNQSPRHNSGSHPKLFVTKNQILSTLVMGSKGEDF